MDAWENAVWQHIEVLARDIGPRPAGSAGNRAAAEYIAGRLAGAGLSVQRQGYDWPDWSVSETLLELDGECLVALPNTYSPACEISAPLAAVGTLAELRAAGPEEVQGKIVLAHGGLARAGLTPAYAIYAFEPDPVVEALKAARPAAVIMAHTRRAGIQPLIEDCTFPIPSVTVPADAGLRLALAAGKTARLGIRSASQAGRAENMVARIAGRRRERVVVCAHFDTKHATPGAFDNASGTALLLALAEHFAANAQALPAGLEFVAFNGEENGGSDFNAYLEHEPDFEHILAVINLDGLGTRLGATSYTVMSGCPALESAVDALAAGFNRLVKVDAWYESDHSAFTFRGVPGIPLTTAGAPEIIHSTEDTCAWLDPHRLAEAGRFVQALVEELMGRTLAECRHAAVSS